MSDLVMYLSIAWLFFTAAHVLCSLAMLDWMRKQVAAMQKRLDAPAPKPVEVKANIEPPKRWPRAKRWRKGKS